MQDPFFQLSKEDPLALDAFFSTEMGLGMADQAQIPGGTSNGDGIANDSAEMKPEQVEAIEQSRPDDIAIKPIEEAKTLGDRIEAVRKEYNDKMTYIYGEIAARRLLTLANRLTKEGFYKQANALCDILQDKA